MIPILYSLHVYFKILNTNSEILTGQTQAVFWKYHGINLCRTTRLSGYRNDSQFNNGSTYDFSSL